MRTAPVSVPTTNVSSSSLLNDMHVIPSSIWTIGLQDRAHVSAAKDRAHVSGVERDAEAEAERETEWERERARDTERRAAGSCVGTLA